MIHDDFDGEAAIDSVREQILSILATHGPRITLLNVAAHNRGGFAVHFDCPDEERMPLAKRLLDAGFRQVI